MRLDYYFAGDLFDHKDLIGNHLLADSVMRGSGGIYRALLPQSGECEVRPDALEIRDADYELLLHARLALFNFDGPDLDSGTVAEFMAARMLDIPSLLLRTDFRSGGDQMSGGSSSEAQQRRDPWNLMCSGYPRTRVLIYPAMTRYQKVFQGENELENALKSFYGDLAAEIIRSFDELMKIPPLLDTKEKMETAVRMFLSMCGPSLEKRFNERKIQKILSCRFPRG